MFGGGRTQGGHGRARCSAFIQDPGWRRANCGSLTQKSLGAVRLQGRDHAQSTVRAAWLYREGHDNGDGTACLQTSCRPIFCCFLEVAVTYMFKVAETLYRTRF